MSVYPSVTEVTSDILPQYILAYMPYESSKGLTTPTTLTTLTTLNPLNTLTNLTIPTTLTTLTNVTTLTILTDQKKYQEEKWRILISVNSLCCLSMIDYQKLRTSPVELACVD